MVFVVVGLLILLTARVMTVPEGSTELDMLETVMVWVVLAVQPMFVDRALTIDKVTVSVQVPVAMEISLGIVILTPAPIPKGLLMVMVKL